jgi:hypothetical protein
MMAVLEEALEYGQKDDKSLKIKADAIIPMEKAEETWMISLNFRHFRHSIAL